MRHSVSAVNAAEIIYARAFLTMYSRTFRAYNDGSALSASDGTYTGSYAAQSGAIRCLPAAGRPYKWNAITHF